MKRILILLAALLLCLGAAAQNGKSIYQKYSDAEHVSAVYISPAMFRLIGRIPDLETREGNVNLTPVIRSLTGMYILNSENPDINGSLRSEVERFIRSGKYELLMEAKNDGETVRMYTVGSEQIINGFVMLAAQADEVTFICLDGQMPREQFETLVAEQMSDGEPSA
uniref:Putative lipoprotein n=1 Tax=uncultured bacterium Contig39 TaxID=1393565 RepID=W0FRE9_9BACT|nr:putative lipoprotein [uncultured bacterium Contig39]